MTLLLEALRERLQNYEMDEVLSDHPESAGGKETRVGSLESREALIDSLGMDAATIASTYLLATDGTPKLRISNADEATLITLVQEGLSAFADYDASAPKVNEEDAAVSALIVGNARYFAEKLAGLEDAELQTLMKELNRLIVVGAELESGDQPQLVFETLNSRGMPLSTTDLIRNLLLSSYDYDEQAKLFERSWRPVQELFFDDDERLYVDAAV